MKPITLLTVLYDGNCSFCGRCMVWLQDQEQRIPLEFVPLHSPLARQRYPSLTEKGNDDELIVINNLGQIYRKDKAFIMCLFALEQYQEWAFHFSKPVYRPFIRHGYQYLSHFRFSLSKLFSSNETTDIIRRLQHHTPEDTCQIQKN